ncbi:hypothetical protein ACJMK2_009392 [Sinanodonta woodiana]|uniref:TIR domain-containing protein n=1 Tax=Sinanodonta woodiana TaxID=1069815 RepID=A0ABD3VC32_SINWO
MKKSYVSVLVMYVILCFATFCSSENGTETENDVTNSGSTSQIVSMDHISKASNGSFLNTIQAVIQKSSDYENSTEKIKVSLIDHTNTVTVKPVLVNSSTLNNTLNSGNRTKRNNTQERIMDFTEFLPPYWRPFCVMVHRPLNISLNVLLIECDVHAGTTWSIHEYRKWNADLMYTGNDLWEDLRFSVDILCTHGGSVFLPWPFRAANLWRLSIKNCDIMGFTSEYNRQDFSNEPDQLVFLEIVDSRINETTFTAFDEKIPMDNRTRALHCGPENLHVYIVRNFTHRALEDRFKNSTEVEFVETPTEALVAPDPFAMLHIPSLHQHHHDHEETEVCRYTNLIYVDESLTSLFLGHHLHVMGESAKYPVLEYLNLSFTGLKELPIVALEWGLYWPEMRYLDLSHNQIRSFTAISDHGQVRSKIGVIDLRHNQITTIQDKDIEVLKVHSRTVLLNISRNPFNCDCEMKDFVTFLNIGNLSHRYLRKYTYFYDLVCHAPEKYDGKKISSLKPEAIDCPFAETVFLVGPMIVPAVVFTIVVVILILIIRYRKEITILAFTRFNILLPCQKIEKSSKKVYDAFISYSSDDSSWVIENLASRLEYSIGGFQGFKLCLHHRDFEVGAAISDNISRSVESSRHTVIILSNNFLRSEWCIMEFRAAFHQSLLERKKHLIFVVLDDVDLTDMESDLRHCLRTLTYLKADDRLFWDKLIYALSDKLRRGRRTQSISTLTSQLSTISITSAPKSPDSECNGYNYKCESDANFNDIPIIVDNDVFAISEESDCTTVTASENSIIRNGFITMQKQSSIQKDMMFMNDRNPRILNDNLSSVLNQNINKNNNAKEGISNLKPDNYVTHM